MRRGVGIAVAAVAGAAAIGGTAVLAVTSAADPPRLTVPAVQIAEDEGSFVDAGPLLPGDLLEGTDPGDLLPTTEPTLIVPGGDGGPTEATLASVADPRGASVDKQEYIDVVTTFLEGSFADYPCRDAFSLGDWGDVNGRITDDDVQIFLNPPFLDTDAGGLYDAVAIYANCEDIGKDTPGGIVCDRYFNDIVVSTGWRNQPEVLWHETMHAIFDEHDTDLIAAGLPVGINGVNDEILTWYLNEVFGAMGQQFALYVDELRRVDDQGKPACNAQRLEGRRTAWSRAMNAARRNAGQYGHVITEPQFGLLRDLTGLDVRSETIAACLAERGLDRCPDTSLAGTYRGMLPVTAEGFGQIGEIPFEIRVAEDLALIATFEGSVAATIDGVPLTYTGAFTCEGRVSEDGTAECTGDGVASVDAMGQTYSYPSTVTATGRVSGDRFDFTIVGIGGTVTGSADRVGT